MTTPNSKQGDRWMSDKPLNIFERTRAYILSKMGYRARQIARQLNRHQRVITRELKRNTQPELAKELAW